MLSNIFSCHIQKPIRGLLLFLPTATAQDISPPKANKNVTALSPHKTLKHKEQHRYKNISLQRQKTPKHPNVENNVCLNILVELQP